MQQPAAAGAVGLAAGGCGQGPIARLLAAGVCATLQGRREPCQARGRGGGECPTNNDSFAWMHAVSRRGQLEGSSANKGRRVGGTHYCARAPAPSFASIQDLRENNAAVPKLTRRPDSLPASVLCVPADRPSAAMEQATINISTDQIAKQIRTPGVKKPDVFDAEDFDAVKIVNQIYPDGERARW